MMGPCTPHVTLIVHSRLFWRHRLVICASWQTTTLTREEYCYLNDFRCLKRHKCPMIRGKQKYGPWVLFSALQTECRGGRLCASGSRRSHLEWSSRWWTLERRSPPWSAPSRVGTARCTCDLQTHAPTAMQMSTRANAALLVDSLAGFRWQKVVEIQTVRCLLIKVSIPHTRTMWRKKMTFVRLILGELTNRKNTKVLWFQSKTNTSSS